jgi:hypothetical protein
MPCGQLWHRYGTSDPEHKYDAMGCVNTLRGRVEELNSEVAKWIRMDKLAWDVAGDYWDRIATLEALLREVREAWGVGVYENADKELCARIDAALAGKEAPCHAV